MDLRGTKSSEMISDYGRGTGRTFQNRRFRNELLTSVWYKNEVSAALIEKIISFESI